MDDAGLVDEVQRTEAVVHDGGDLTLVQWNMWVELHEFLKIWFNAVHHQKQVIERVQIWLLTIWTARILERASPGVREGRTDESEALLACLGRHEVARGGQIDLRQVNSRDLLLDVRWHDYVYQIGHKFVILHLG